MAKQRTITIDLLENGSFKYEPSSVRLPNRLFNRGRVVWQSTKPFCIDFDDRSPLGRVTFSSTMHGEDRHRTRKAKVKSQVTSGRYKYRVFVYDKTTDLIHIDDCPDVGFDEDKC